MEAKPSNGMELGPEAYKLRQQNIQLRYSLKYKDEVEIPNLHRELEHQKHQLAIARELLKETQKQEDFLDRQTGIIHLDTSNRIIKLNSYAQEILGTILPQALGRPLQEVGTHAESGRPIFHDLETHLEPEGKESEWEKEIPLVNGEKRYYQFRGLLSRGTRLISIQDKTALRVSESRVKAIIGSSKDGIVVVDESQVIRFTNSRFGKLFNLNWRQFNGMEFSLAADLLQYHFKESQTFADFYSHTAEELQIHAEGLFEMALPQEATFQIFTRPIMDEQSRIIGRVWYVTDVTKFKDMEKTLMANALELEDKVRDRTEELSIQNQELVKVKQHLEQASIEMEMELDMAKQVQQGLLPRNLPDLPGYSLAAAYLPTGKVGGDFYDIIQLNERSVFLLMADVSGHGVPAALVTAMAKMAFNRHVRQGVSVAKILHNVNLDLCAAVTTDHYLTAFAAILELDTGRLEYSRVCHPYPIVFRTAGNKLEHLQMRGGFFLGMFEENQFTEESTVLQPGDMLFAYTDGINESFNHSDEQYGRDRLDKVVLKYAAMGPQETIQQAQYDKDRFSGGRASLDDITIFSVQRS